MTKATFLQTCTLPLAWVGEEEYRTRSYGNEDRSQISEQYLEVVLPVRELVEIDSPAGGRRSFIRYVVLESVRLI